MAEWVEAGNAAWESGVRVPDRKYYLNHFRYEYVYLLSGTLILLRLSIFKTIASQTSLLNYL